VTLPQGGDFTGRDGVTRFFEGVGAAWESLHIEVEAVGELGDDLGVGVVRCSGSLREGGPGEYGAVHVFTVKNNKIIPFREYVDLDRPIAP
jgi:ketosteroid isomerase-like protein